MQHSEQIGELAGAIAKARPNFGTVRKDRQGQVGKGTYKYATLEAVIDATADALAEQGVTVSQSVTAEVRGEGEAASGWCVVHTIALHSSGQWLRARAEAPIQPEYSAAGNLVLSPVQDLGKVSTYLRRYSLTAILGVTAEDDTDGAKRPEAPRGQRAPERRPDPPKPASQPADADRWTPAEQRQFFAALKAAGVTQRYDDIAAWCESIGRPRPSAMTAKQRDDLIVAIKPGGAAEDRLVDFVEQAAKVAE